MNASPTPVAEMATVVSSAHVPAPTMALSPTRPGGLPAMPPVEVAAARWPYYRGQPRQPCPRCFFQ